MGEYVGLQIGNFDFLCCKNSFGDLLNIFSKDDLKIEQIKDEDGEIYEKRYFSTTVQRAKMCLDCLGYTRNSAKSDFEKSKAEELEQLDYYTDSDEEYEEKYTNIKNDFIFENWEKAVKKYAVILANDHYDSSINGYKNLELERSNMLSVSERIVIDTLPYEENFFGLYWDQICPWNVFRIILDAFKPEEIIELDYTNLYDGGWCDEFPDEKDYAVSKTIVLTEGKFDVEVLTEAINLLYPYMNKFYSFIDFSGYNVAGSANFVSHYLRAFIASGIENRVIAIYDNDAAGHAEIIGLKQITIPENYRVLCLPELEFAKNYPTLGPNGKESMDINGRACSIELFLGKDVLQNEGEYIPVHWKGFNDKTQTYQGEIKEKALIQKRFKERIKKAKLEGFNYDDWKELDMILEKLFSAFCDK